MKINSTSLEKLRKLIIEEITYRSGPELVKYFNDIGFDDTYERGFPSRWIFTDSKLNELNNSDSIDKAIYQLFDPIRFIDNEEQLNLFILDFNKYLEFDNYRIIKRKNKIEIKKLDNRIEILKNYSELQLVKYLKNGLIADVRNNSNGLHPDEYVYCRNIIIQNKELKNFAPDYIKRYEDYSSVIDTIIQQSYGFDDRESYINNSFKVVLSYLENNGIAVIAKQISFNESYIHDEWQKAIKRNAEKDYDGAITIAKTMLESLFKFILCQLNVDFDNEKSTFPELYKLVIKQLKLSPDEYSESIFKQILSGVKATVEGLGSLRNKLGDAHGKKPNNYKPKERHSELVVNLSGTVALFIYKTYKDNNCNK